MDKSQKAIEAWHGSNASRSSYVRGYSLEESATMIRVMRETKGEGGPWFKEYAEKNNLL